MTRRGAAKELFRQRRREIVSDLMGYAFVMVCGVVVLAWVFAQIFKSMGIPR